MGEVPFPQASALLRGLQALALPAAEAPRKKRTCSSTSERYSSAKGQIPGTLCPEQLKEAGLWLSARAAPSSTPLGWGY